MAACFDAHARAMHVRAAQLGGSADARDRAVHALSLGVRTDEAGEQQQARALARLVVAAPQDRWIAWLHVQACHAPSCDRQAAVQGVLRLDPDNALSWMLAVDEEKRRGDLVQADRLLERAARAPNMEMYWEYTARQATQRLGAIAWPPVCRPVAAGIGETLALDRPATSEDLVISQAVNFAGLQMPPLTSTLGLCPPRKPIAAHRLPACRALFIRMAGNSTLLFQVIGVRGMDTHARTAADRAYWRERRRNLAWLSQESPGLVNTPAHQHLLWEQGEVPTLIATLEAAGRWPAPAGWLPPGFDEP